MLKGPKKRSIVNSNIFWDLNIFCASAIASRWRTVLPSFHQSR